MSDPIDGNRIYSKILQTLYLSGNHSDIVLAVENPNNRYHVHKGILSAASEYFHGMFSGSFRESKQEEVHLTSIDSTSLGIILKLIYGFNVEFNSLRDEDVVVEVLKAANLLQIDFICEYCWAFLAKRIHEENCWTILRLADMMAKRTVYDEVIRFVGMHLKQLWKSQELLEVDILTITNILKSNDLKVHSEDDVFFLMVAWINYDMDVRFKFCPELLKYIRLNLMTSQFITDNIRPLAVSKETRAMIENAIKWFEVGKEEQTIGSNVSPRKTIGDKLLAVVGFCKTITVHGYCPLAKVWTRDILNVELDFKPKILGIWRDFLILFNEKINRMYLLSMDTGDLSSEIELARRSNFATSCWKTFCYIIGGLRIEAVRSVQKYNFTTEVWTGIPSMNEPRQLPGTIITSDGVLYAIGGGSYERAENSCEYLNLAEKDEEWTELLPPMPFGRFAPQVVECLSCLYVFGGYTIIDQECCLSTVQKYDLVAKEWTVLGNLDLDSLIKLSVSSIKDQIYILAVDHKRRTRFGIYNTQTNSFEELLNAQEMEEIDHKFHSAMLYFVHKSDLVGK